MMSRFSYTDIADQVREIAWQAGQLILSFGTDFDVHKKRDASPVTSADIAANQYIVNALTKLTPGVMMIAEESKDAEHQRIDEQERFWLVDPLDGTKSFVRGESTYTVNIGLIEKGRPAGGVVVCPAKRLSYFTAKDGLAYKQEQDQLPQRIQVRKPPKTGLVVVVSHFHIEGRTKAFIDTLPLVDKIANVSSSIKFCMIAEGQADIYPRFGTTMEWDTAAGHAVLQAAGGSVTTLDGDPYEYGKPGFINQPFLAKGRFSL